MEFLHFLSVEMIELCKVKKVSHPERTPIYRRESRDLAVFIFRVIETRFLLRQESLPGDSVSLHLKCLSFLKAAITLTTINEKRSVTP